MSNVPFSDRAAGLHGDSAFLRRPGQRQFVPFIADYRETDNAHLVMPDKFPEERVLEGRYHRDRSGRLRQEDRVLIGPDRRPGESRLIIVDQSLGLHFRLFPDQKFGLRKRLRRGAGSALPVAPNESPVRGEDLGEKTIDDLTCQGRRTYSTTSAAYTDTWWCPAVEYPLIIVRREPSGITYEGRWFNLKVVDPDPALFKIPEDYTIVGSPPLSIPQPQRQQEPAAAKPRLN